jgi:hypothetical protein
LGGGPNGVRDGDAGFADDEEFDVVVVVGVALRGGVVAVGATAGRSEGDGSLARFFLSTFGLSSSSLTSTIVIPLSFLFDDDDDDDGEGATVGVARIMYCLEHAREQHAKICRCLDGFNNDCNDDD